MDSKELGIVIVFYNPTRENINAAIKLSEKHSLVIVDNSEINGSYHIPRAKIIFLEGNQGIATALNIGIKDLINDAYKYALLLDQDSEPEDFLILSLLDYIRESPEKVCLVSPAYYDKAIERKAEFILCKDNCIERQPAEGNLPISASYVITSGSMLKLSTLEKIGLMKDDLFIDFVDIEWCLRARYFGYEILGLPWLTMTHEIGGEPVRIARKKYVNHSPIRHYYYFRNVFLLLRLKYIHPQWKKHEMLKLLPRFIVYAFFTKNRLNHIKAMITGIKDGVLGYSGKKR
ncbi:glycosyltransferase family 2 protein [Pseudescherichia sp.]|uniref:glycosyltransferase family 2 protein n=1 Tax=Pseudescherichia sp. TaxID=2055881 RepID=UPI002897218A|nr:glycosyltransferase family 2 protein [Pseudescherichia sp.]